MTAANHTHHDAAARLWSLGDYEAIARLLEPVAEAAIDAGDPRPGERVLDVGAGTGNAALLAAERGADVVAVEPTPRLRELGERRAAAGGVSMAWTSGTAERLPLPDGAFDATVSVLAAMFSPDPPMAARELVRVTRPGGRIVLASWTREGLSGQLSACVSRHVAAPPGMVDPHDWGDPERLRGWFGPRIASLRSQTHQVTWRFDDVDRAVGTLERDAAAFVAARAAIGDDRWPTVRAELGDVLRGAGRARDGAFAVDWTYLLATARLPGSRPAA